MKKFLAIMFSFLLIISIAQPATASTGKGNFHLHTVAATYEGNSLILKSVVANTGNATLKAVSKLELSVFDKNEKFVTKTTLSNDPWLSNLDLAPGESSTWTLTILNVPSADLSSYSVKYNSEFLYGKAEFTSGIKVVVNNKFLPESQQAIIQNGSTLVPMRAIFESLGAEVKWDSKTKTVTAIKGNDKLVLKIGDKHLTKNGTKVAFDVPAKIANNLTLVPLRIISESFDGDVLYGKTGNATTIAIRTY